MGEDQDKFDERDKEAVMMLKLFVTDEMLSEVRTRKTSTEIWKHLKELHETLDKGEDFFLKNMLFSIKMDESVVCIITGAFTQDQGYQRTIVHDWSEDGSGGHGGNHDEKITTCLQALY